TPAHDHSAVGREKFSPAAIATPQGAQIGHPFAFRPPEDVSLTRTRSTRAHDNRAIGSGCSGIRVTTTKCAQVHQPSGFRPPERVREKLGSNRTYNRSASRVHFVNSRLDIQGAQIGRSTCRPLKGVGLAGAREAESHDNCAIGSYRPRPG